MLDTNYAPIVCPFCQSTSVSFSPVPEHIRQWNKPEGVEYTEHWGECREYECENCECVWTMPEDQFHD